MSDETGARVRALRTARGIGQAELAASIGVSKSYLSHLEAGRRSLRPDLVRKLATALEVEPDALESGTPVDVAEELRLRLAFAELSLRNGDKDLAAREFEAVLERSLSMPFGRFGDEARLGLAGAEAARGNLEAAIVSYEELVARPALSPAVSRVLVWMRLVMVYSEVGDLGRAVDLGEQALAELETYPVPPDVNERVELISTVAGCYLERGDLVRARLLIARAIAISDAEGSPRARAAASWNAAVIALEARDLPTARMHADRALALYAEQDNARAVAMLRVVSAHVRLREEVPDAPGALDDLNRAIEDLREVGTLMDLAYAWTQEARALLVAGDLEAAAAAGHRALEETSRGDRLLHGDTLLVLGHVARARGDDEEAVELYRAAAEALEATDAGRQAGRAWRELGEASWELGRAEDAVAALRRASDVAGATYHPLRRRSSHVTGGAAG